MRLDKFLSHQLEISRNQVNKLLKDGAIRVDDDIVKTGAYKISPEQHIFFDDQLIEQRPGHRYIMLHKPAGYVCSTDDPLHPTVLYFIEEPMVGKLHSAGRLDCDTTGLVLLTDDGQWSHRITSPRYECEKTYLVTLQKPLSDDLIAQFAQGILLRNESAPTKPAKLNILDEYHASLTISEGRYHQVKRMFAAVGNHVVALHRSHIGGIALDVAEGEYRHLTEDEIQQFQA